MADEPQPEKLEQLNRLEDLSNKDLKTVIDKGRHVRLPANWSLIWEKTPADKAYLIVDGEVSVRKGKEEVARLGPGDVIGEMAIVGPQAALRERGQPDPARGHPLHQGIPRASCSTRCPRSARRCATTTTDRLATPKD